MKIPKYWAKGIQTAQGADGKTVTFTCWRWSEMSVDDARLAANSRAKELAWKLANGQKLDRYSYGERPLREEITEAITDGGGRELALVTRNGYGALVLNAARAMFIDIDFEEEKQKGSLVRGLFGPGEKKAPTQEARIVAGVEEWTRKQPGLGLRIYRTFGGLRCLITTEVFDPTQESTLAILRSLNSDPLYVKLCRSQGCFRARLTPKPWRCGLGNPPSRYPWDDYAQEARYRQWQTAYTATAARYGVCNLVREIGPQDVHPEVKTILSLHDRLSCSDRGLPLA